MLEEVGAEAELGALRDDAAGGAADEDRAIDASCDIAGQDANNLRHLFFLVPAGGRFAIVCRNRGFDQTGGDRHRGGCRPDATGRDAGVESSRSGSSRLSWLGDIVFGAGIVVAEKRVDHLFKLRDWESDEVLTARYEHAGHPDPYVAGTQVPLPRRATHLWRGSARRGGTRAPGLRCPRALPAGVRRTGVGTARSSPGDYLFAGHLAPSPPGGLKQHPGWAAAPKPFRRRETAWPARAAAGVLLRHDDARPLRAHHHRSLVAGLGLDLPSSAILRAWTGLAWPIAATSSPDSSERFSRRWVSRPRTLKSSSLARPSRSSTWWPRRPPSRTRTTSTQPWSTSGVGSARACRLRRPVRRRTRSSYPDNQEAGGTAPVPRLEVFFAGRGFAIVYPEDMPYAEQKAMLAAR